MKVLIACEFSGRVRDAFIKLGHDACSCDFLPTESPGPHLEGNVLDYLNSGWDLMICHPPCTYLAASGARWWKGRQTKQALAVRFAKMLWECDIPRIAMENPVGKLSSEIGKPDQIVQPWWFGHGETKATCLWLKNLPALKPTWIVSGREAVIHKMSPSKDRWKNRSRTYSGLAQAMAEQWGGKVRREWGL